MRIKEKIYSMAIQKGKGISPDDIERIEELSDFYEDAAVEDYEKLWNDEGLAKCRENEKKGILNSFKENMLPLYEKISPKKASALKTVFDNYPNFISEGCLSDEILASIEADCGHQITVEIQTVIAGIYHHCKDVIEEMHSSFLEKYVETFMAEYIDEIINEVLNGCCDDNADIDLEE